MWNNLPRGEMTIPLWTAVQRTLQQCGEQETTMHDDICGYCGETGDGQVCTVCQEEMFVREQAIRALLDVHHATHCEAPTGRIVCTCGAAEEEVRTHMTAHLIAAAA